MEVETRTTEELAEFVAHTQWENFPPEARHIAKRCFIDGIGVILAGSEDPCTHIIRDYVLSLGGKKESTLLAKEKAQTPAPFAALVNGTAGHAMDWDDTALSNTPDRMMLLHPTVAPLAAGLAIGEKMSVSGEELLVAFLAGYEVECKIAEAIHAEHWMRGFHTQNTCGVFGATATAAKLMRLTVNEIRSAFGIATSLAGGCLVNLGTMAKPLHMGLAAQNGILSAQWAALGFEAHLAALEGHKGFFHAFAGGFDPGKIHGKLGRVLAILSPGVSIKPYPCGVVGHPAMDTMRALVVEHDIQPEDVDWVKVATGSNVLPPRGPLRYQKAQNALEAKFCLPFLMASMIIRHRAGIMEFTDNFVRSPGIQEMMGRVETIIDPAIDALGRNKIVSVIEVKLKDGRIFRGKSGEHYRGGPHNPLRREELAEKFNDCVQQVLNAAQSQNIFETIMSLESLHDIHTLIEMITNPS